MKKLFSYFVWSLFALALVFASVAIPVALSEAQEKKVANQVTILRVDEPEQNYLSHTISLAERVRVFVNADLNTRIARNAYISEMTMEEITAQTNTFLVNWMAEYQKENEAVLGIPALEAETILSSAGINAILYESPSGSTKIPYWQIEYLWHTKDKMGVTEEEWPMFSVLIICDTATGEPYLISYEYIPWVPYSESCGLVSYAKVLGLTDKLRTDKIEQSEGSKTDSEIMIRAKKNYYFRLEGQEFCFVKSMYIDGAGREQIQLIPLEKIQ